MDAFLDSSLTKIRNEELNEYRKTGKFTDVILQSSDNHLFKVHKIILSSSCSYFRGMFSSAYIESHEKVTKLNDNLTKDDLEIILEYLYTGTVTIAPDNARNLYIKAQFMNLAVLQDFCSNVLIKTLNIENVLELWRFASRFSNEILGTGCAEFCALNIQKCLQIYLMDLTFKELKSISSYPDLKINQEILYLHLSRWLKKDFKTREKYLLELMNLVDFTTMSGDFLVSEVMPDPILSKNCSFSQNMAQILACKLTKAQTSLRSLQMNSKERFHINLPIEPTLNLVTSSNLFLLYRQQKKWTKYFNLEPKLNLGNACAVYYGNIYVSGNYESNQIQFYDAVACKVCYLPPMIERRNCHRSIQLNSNIFSCGGWRNGGSTEMFDIQKCVWLKSAPMKESKSSFGIAGSVCSIYVCGGLLDKGSRMHTVESYDWREGIWRGISGHEEPIKFISKSVLLNNSLYCFDSESFCGSIFDLRSNKWRGISARAISIIDGISYNSRCCDVTELMGKIFGIFKSDLLNTLQTFEYDPVKNIWENLNIQLDIDSSDRINIYPIGNKKMETCKVCSI